jgi:hypothetical protein
LSCQFWAVHSKWEYTQSVWVCYRAG